MNKEALRKFLISRCIPCSEEQANQLEKLMNETLKTNELFNLTAITDPSIFMEKMILDSAIGIFDQDLTGKKVLDVGTGGGFPGLVLYILNPGMKLTLLDSTKKKIDYLDEYAAQNNFNIEGVTARVEELAHRRREEFDVVYARAVAPLNILLELTIPLLKIGGTLIAMKGPDWENEYIAAKSALKKLNCRLKKVYEETLPESNEQRAIISIVKDRISPIKYPRPFADIKRKPL
ncbi:MAG TPA: 16S rRNA (guanine(527)-N(7))-methyltransferase RsmG [Bacilli bacterium]|nr:16S rRNA (guanine(527)-N(7))-methyltransferase RsmG [Bacilli bacterium]HPS18585.1 16S rRNA (guanine(527)-N(7))-methyltransferase RsmG [Bacilli bacterium]